VALGGFPRFCNPIHPTPATDDSLDVLGGAGPADREQLFFRLGRGDASQRPDFRVRELAARERLRQPWQRAERARDTDAFPHRPRIEADAPGEPCGARAEAIVPAAAGVELDGMDSSRDLYGIGVPKSPCVHRPLWKEEST
jgi:hypothetical protein